MFKSLDLTAERIQRGFVWYFIFRYKVFLFSFCL